MKLQNLYLLFILLGIVLPYSQFIPFVFENGMDMNLFISRVFDNRASAFVAMDLTLSALVFVFFTFTEGERIKLRKYWIPIIVTILVGFSVGFPLFLFMRERHLRKNIAT